MLERELAASAIEPPTGLARGLVGGFVGYIGYECKADCGSPNAHRSDIPDAVLMLANRVVAVDHVRHRTHAARPRADDEAPEARALAGSGRARRSRSCSPPPSAPAAAPPAAARRGVTAEPVVFRLRARPRAVPRGHRALPGRTGRRRVLRGLPHRPDLDHASPDPFDALPPAAAQQPGAVRRLPASSASARS